jgi:hypothetical protein
MTRIATVALTSFVLHRPDLRAALAAACTTIKARPGTDAVGPANMCLWAPHAHAVHARPANTKMLLPTDSRAASIVLAASTPVSQEDRLAPHVRLESSRGPAARAGRPAIVAPGVGTPARVHRAAPAAQRGSTHRPLVDRIAARARVARPPVPRARRRPVTVWADPAVRFVLHMPMMTIATAVAVATLLLVLTTPATVHRVGAIVASGGIKHPAATVLNATPVNSKVRATAQAR